MRMKGAKFEEAQTVSIALVDCPQPIDVRASAVTVEAGTVCLELEGNPVAVFALERFAGWWQRPPATFGVS